LVLFQNDSDSISGRQLDELRTLRCLGKCVDLVVAANRSDRFFPEVDDLFIRISLFRERYLVADALLLALAQEMEREENALASAHEALNALESQFQPAHMVGPRRKLGRCTDREGYGSGGGSATAHGGQTWAGNLSALGALVLIFLGHNLKSAYHLKSATALVPAVE